MKKLIYSIIVISLMFSCTEDFEDINTNNNTPTDVAPEFLLPTVIFNLADKVTNEGYDMGEILPQYGAYYEYNGTDIYNWGADDTFWEMYDYLKDLEDVKGKAITLNNANYEGVSLILETYIMHLITDTYGYAPYSEAMQLDDGVLSPRYDSQEEIYMQLFENLERANQIINDSDEIQGDILFNGNMDLWRKFGNTLRVRLLMRVSNKMDVSAQLAEIVSDPSQYPLIESVSENAEYTYAGTYPNAAPFTAPRGSRAYGYELIVPTTTLIGTLQDFDDPRLYEWVDPKEGTEEYIGLQPGLPLGEILEPVEYAARAKSYFNSGNKAKAWLITYSELNFLLAEAAERGLISGDAANYYNQGVEASFEQWGVDMPSNYLTDEAPYDSNTEILYVQKWLALYHAGIEAWMDWKRTGKPSFIQPGPGAQINEVPRRLMYPSIEQSINAEHYQEAVQAMGGDNITQKVWWDNF